LTCIFQTVRYVGEVKPHRGTWVGIELDEPKGRNNGAANGHQYFTTKMNFGVFTRPANIKVLLQAVQSPHVIVFLQILSDAQYLHLKALLGAKEMADRHVREVRAIASKAQSAAEALAALDSRSIKVPPLPRIDSKEVDPKLYLNDLK
jgi:hypothetical protein